MEMLYDTADVYALGVALHGLLKGSRQDVAAPRSPTRRRGDYKVGNFLNACVLYGSMLFMQCLSTLCGPLTCPGPCVVG
jgi:hypothetical protein